jgi:hypothetical protein
MIEGNGDPFYLKAVAEREALIEREERMERCQNGAIAPEDIEAAKRVGYHHQQYNRSPQESIRRACAADPSLRMAFMTFTPETWYELARQVRADREEIKAAWRRRVGLAR